ncbi:FAD-binding oxidoreductase [Pontibacter silvestris]|uniref:FAD-binding oxidoreductase n=1 Tax=Pontibacter silvestris TaxID=2305183 RepID=A0ABW4WUI8_9BACT|nr:FAD-linked oxidase C-terminal domain-containing protein [Pontibacter silvestris]MCC9138107.1 FAD-binding protein [Pontibacter silvestris]
MKFNTVTPDILEALAAIVGQQHVVLPEATEQMLRYTHDETEDLHYEPELVLKPANASEISSIMQLCNQNLIPVTPRGAGTGLSGGALPIHKGVVISTERLNKIINIDERNLQATVEPGVITQVFQEEVIARGLFYPPDPSSRGSCFLGGNLSESSGGPRAVKYGVTKDYVLNMEVVLPSGEITWTGANVLKNATGYNLTQLMIGSEGTLGIITKIVFRLIPYPSQNLVMLVPFKKEEEACEAVPKIFIAGIVPSAMEFMERDAIEWTNLYLGMDITVPEDVQAHLLIELDGNDMDILFKDAERVYEVLESFNVGEMLIADTEKQKTDLWLLRRNVAHAVKHNSVYKEEDTVVPRAELPTLIRGIKEIGTRYNFKSVCYGHAGDGNLHINIVKGEMSDDDWNNKLPEGIKEIFRLCVGLGGTISGEHGVGLVQRPYIGIALNEIQLRLMRGIKDVFDPNGILNPGKIFRTNAEVQEQHKESLLTDLI